MNICSLVKEKLVNCNELSKCAVKSGHICYDCMWSIFGIKPLTHILVSKALNSAFIVTSKLALNEFMYRNNDTYSHSGGISFGTKEEPKYLSGWGSYNHHFAGQANDSRHYKKVS